MYKLPVLLITASLILGIPSWSQKKLTLSAFTGSGISFFSGAGAVNNSTYYISDVPSIPNTIGQPYGKKPFANFLAGLQADLTLSSKWTLSLSSQYEHTGGKLAIDTIISRTGMTKADGKYKRYYDFISINPQIGRILFQKLVRLTIHTGIDYALKLDRGEQSDYTDQTSTAYSGDEPEVNDLRITFGTSVSLKKWSLDINYKHGLVNYWKDGPGKVYARLVQVRLLYSFLSKKI
jgi:hypothetical protein